MPPRQPGAGGGVPNICCAVCFGLLLFFGSLFLLFWNEGSAVAVATSLDEGLRAVKPLQLDKVTDSVARAHEGKLIHITGPIDVSEVGDPTFGIRLKALRLHRSVQMFQCIERKTTSERQVRNEFGQMEVRKLTEYSYYGDWSSTLQHPRTYAYPERCGSVEDRPSHPASFPYDSQEFQAHDVNVGPFRLSAEVQSQITATTRINPSDPAVLGLPSGTSRAETETALAKHIPSGLEVMGSEIRTIRRGPPKIGDVMIRFEATLPATYSFGKTNKQNIQNILIYLFISCGVVVVVVV